jgi:hypothetical protein
MAASERIERCRNCGRADGHLDACPVQIGTPEAMAEWKRGYEYGFEDNYIHPYSLKLYSPSFCLGYGIGKDRIDRLVEQAVERNYGYEYDE